jgi:hypothetical protein
MPVDVLKDHPIAAEHSINEAVRELEANPKYQELKEGELFSYRRFNKYKDLVKIIYE